MTRDEAINEIKNGGKNIVIAMSAMGKVGNVSDISFLMPMASNNAINPTMRKLTIDAICTIIKESMLTRFSELTPEMRQKLATILQTLDPKIINEISKDLQSHDNNRRLYALQMLGILRRHPHVKELLIQLLPDKDPKIKATVVSLLGKMMGPNDQQIVITLLNDEDKRVRANTVEAIEGLGNPHIAPTLFKYRKDPNNRIRGNVLKALYNLGHPDIEEDLLEMLTSKEPGLKASALWVITQVKYNKSHKVIDVSAACLLSSNNMVRRNAIIAMNALSTPRSLGYLKYLSNVYEEDKYMNNR